MPEQEPAQPSSPFAVAAVQMPVISGDNLATIRAYAQHIRQRFPWVGMVLFSELCVFGPSPAHAQALPGPAEDELCKIAQDTGLWLIPGSMFERVQVGGQERIYNTTPIINPQGQVVTRFRKLFPFRPYEQGISAGGDFVVFDVPGAGRFGVSICYDMWFPETTRQLVAMGAEVILHPTMTDTIDRDIELSIARASAAMNQVYFLDVNGVGHGGCGRSIVCDCSGYTLHEAAGEAQIIPIEIDFARIRRERERGLRGLGQPLKSFRDREIEFPVYDKARTGDGALAQLGPLVKPGQTHAGVVSNKGASGPI